MAKFVVAKDLEQKVLPMVVPAVVHIAEQVEDQAKRNAPPVKHWLSQRDPQVRPEHVQADLMHGPGRGGVPDNLRFTLPSTQWDREHRAVGAYSYIDEPPHEGDSRAFVLMVNCFPAETMVSAAQVRGAFRRWYEGDLVRLKTEAGRELAGTPNHEVLTDRGWVALGRLDVGDHLVCAGRSGVGPGAAGVGGVQPDVHDAPARIDEVTRALAEAGRVQRVLGMPMDFHGDGRETEVDVVRAERDLQVGEVPSFRQQAGQLDLPDAEALEVVALSGLRTQDVALASLGAAPAGLVGGSGVGAALVGAHAGGTDPVGLGAAADRDAEHLQPSVDRVPRDAVRLGQGKGRLPRLVALGDLLLRQVEGALARAPRLAARLAQLVEALEHRRPGHTRGVGDALDGVASPEAGRDLVVGEVDASWDAVVAVHRESFSGYVFNLETASNWYVANGIIAHNCRCRTVRDPDGIAKLIATEAPILGPSKVTVNVVAKGDYVVQSEFGTVYPGDLIAPGSFYMRRAAVSVAAKRRTVSVQADARKALFGF